MAPAHCARGGLLQQRKPGAPRLRKLSRNGRHGSVGSGAVRYVSVWQAKLWLMRKRRLAPG
jgi:hypothetical protein